MNITADIATNIKTKATTKIVSSEPVDGLFIACELDDKLSLDELLDVVGVGVMIGDVIIGGVGVGVGVPETPPPADVSL